jgi:hypothetical protein
VDHFNVGGNVSQTLELCNGDCYLCPKHLVRTVLMEN